MRATEKPNRLIALLGAATLALGVAGPASAQELKLPAKKKADPKLYEKRATDAVKGYYEALFRGAYDQAGTFAHPDSIEPVRLKLIELIQRAPEARKGATLKNLGASDVSALQSMTTAQFFAAYTSSTYGKNLQALANPKRKAAIEITEVKCLKDRPACDVTFDLKQTLDDGRRVAGTNQVRASKVRGRWLVGEMVGKRP